MMGCEQSGRFLEGHKDKFLIQILIGPTRGDTQLDLLLTGKKVLIGDVTINGSLGCSNHEMVDLKMLREKSESQSPDPW